MEFGIEKCAMLVMKSGKWHLMDRMKLPNKDKIRTLWENETYKYLGILEAETIKQRWKKKSRKNISGKLERYSTLKELILVRYSGPFLKWTGEFKQMDQRTRKLMTNLSRKEGKRRLASIEDNIDASIQRLEDYIEKHVGGLITATRNDTDNTKTNRMAITKKQN